MTVLQQTFFEASDADLALQYAAVVAKLRGESADDTESAQAEARAAVEKGSAAVRALVERYAAEGAALLNVPETQVEGFYALLLALIQAVASAADSEKLEIELLRAVAKSIEESASDKGVLKIKLLTHLFNNTAVNSSVRLHIFTSLVKVAAKHGELKVLATQVPHIGAWCKQWGASAEQTSALYTLLADKYLAAALWEEAVTVLTAQINQAYENGAKPAKGDIEPIYLRALVAGLAPARKVVNLSDLFVTAATAALAATPAAKILTAYVHGDVNAYKAVHDEVAKLVTKAAIKPSAKSAALVPAAVATATQAKLRMLHLTTLPVGTPLELASVASSLGVKSTREVEVVFISAVASHLVKGKIDGIAQTLLLTATNKPHFTAADWETLLADLDAWKASLGRVSRSINNLRDLDDDDESDEDSLLDEEEDEEHFDDEDDEAYSGDEAADAPAAAAAAAPEAAAAAPAGEDDDDVDAEYVTISARDLVDE
ncbi:Eukaryotic translation initiation factor 3 subunit M [Blastocladiella emersonii ATCC 22665]|nr:Eukaryotic translation initiation factor 3 subunit M [Blastocladiella emersonii ATCC 22665]